MHARRGEHRLHPAWETLILIAVVVGLILLSSALFAGSFKSYVPVVLTSERAGLVMESGAKVKLRGVQVGRVAAIDGGQDPVRLKLEIYPDQVKYIPANVGAEIRATTAFGAKYVNLIYPERPTPERLVAGAVLSSRNVSTEVNTVFQNLVEVLREIDPAKLNGILSALAEGVRGQGENIGRAITDANEVLSAVNPRSETIRQDWRSFKNFNDAYSSAAHDIVSVLDAASTTSSTITNRAAALDALLVNAIGLSDAGINLIGPSQKDFIESINTTRPTIDLLLKYSPEYTCMLMGARWFLENGGYAMAGGANGRSLIVDAAIMPGDDLYRYPDNLPIVAAKGGPGGKPGCGSLPDPTSNYPVRYLVTNTGWGTGLDVRPNPGIGHPWWVNFLPTTRAVPEPPSFRGAGPPAIGPVPYPGAPPYGAPLYGPGGTPLYPGVPPAPQPAPPSP